MGVSGNLWIVVKDVKTLVVYDVERETAMDSNSLAANCGCNDLL